jgi:hypothetical protein
LGPEPGVEVKKKRKNDTHEFSSCVISYCSSKNKLGFPVKFVKIDEKIMKKLQRKIFRLFLNDEFLVRVIPIKQVPHKTRYILMFKLVFKLLS